MSCADRRVLFVAAAGARRGFGHLVRCRSLARAMGVRPLIAVRGGQRVIDTALVLGCDVIPDARPGLVSRIQPDVLVVDDPIARQAAPWIAAGRRAGALVVSIHDLGIGCLHADLVVDGSVTLAGGAAYGETLAGPKYAVLDPLLVQSTAIEQDLVPSGRGRRPRVVISLGGGPRARRAASIAAAIARVQPDAEIRVVGGFLTRAEAPAGSRISWVEAPRGLAPELSRADVAILGGGVSLYEACALGVAAVGVPVVEAQQPTVAAFSRRRATLGVDGVETPADVIARQASRLLTDGALRRRLTRTARGTVDGLGASRVAAAIETLSRQPRGQAPSASRTFTCTCAD
jgi:spore coat polysaccharide biosynthesis predicted glycosyltransferase SpsG